MPPSSWWRTSFAISRTPCAAKSRIPTHDCRRNYAASWRRRSRSIGRLWPWGLTKQKLIAQISERLNSETVGVDFNFSQYIQDNIEEAVSGVKGENSVK